MKRAAIAVLLACASAAACAQILDLEPPPDATAGDASGFDVVVPDVVVVTCTALDAALPDDDAGTTFHPFASDAIGADGGSFSIAAVFEVSMLAGAPSGYAGAAFDGKNVYFAPTVAGGPILQYPIAKSFTSKGSWAEFAPSAVLGDAGATGFSGATFDGKYVYFVPQPSSGTVLRYDSSLPFGSAPSWSTFDTSSIPVPDGGVAARGFSGAVFDGRYLFFVPNAYAPSTPSGRVARYDTQADAGDASVFGSAASWSTFDTSSVNALATGYRGGVFDGRFVYFVPNYNGGPTSSGYSDTIARFDTASDAGFGASSAWSTFGVSQKNPNAVGFVGGAYDGHYVYFVPNLTTTVVRYDTTATFTTSASYEMYDVAPLIRTDGGPPSFAGAAFDGRFVYFVPSGPTFGVALRYDTQSPFGVPCAWSTLDFTHYDSAATDYFGAAYDGRNLYFAPHNAFAARFDTKTPAWMPALPVFQGSFY